MYLGQTGNTTFGFNAGNQTNPFGNTIGSNFGTNTTQGFGTNPSGTPGGSFSTPFGISPFGQNATIQMPIPGLGNATIATFGIQQPFVTSTTAPNFNQNNNNNNSGTGFFNQPQQAAAFQTPQTPNLFVSNSQMFESTNQTPSFFTSTGKPHSCWFPAPVEETSSKLFPVSGFDTTVKNGISYSVLTRNCCITTMQEYQNKSLEELRFEDYKAGRKGLQTLGPFQTGNVDFFNKSGFTVPSTTNVFPSSSINLQNTSPFKTTQPTGPFNQIKPGFAWPTSSTSTGFNQTRTVDFFNKPGFTVSSTTPAFPSSSTNLQNNSPFKLPQSSGPFNQTKPGFTWPTSSTSSGWTQSGFNPGNNSQILFPGKTQNPFENSRKPLAWTNISSISSPFNPQKSESVFKPNTNTSGTTTIPLGTNQIQQNSFPTHEQILALTITPFGDDPLLRNLPAARKSETLEKLINLNKGMKNNQYKISTNNTLKIKPKIITSRSAHRMLFDGFEEENSLIEIFQVRPHAKRLMLRPKSNISKSAENISDLSKTSSTDESRIIDQENQELQSPDRTDSTSDSKSSSSWLKSSINRQKPQENVPLESSGQQDFSEDLDNTIIELRPSLTNEYPELSLSSSLNSENSVKEGLDSVEKDSGQIEPSSDQIELGSSSNKQGSDPIVRNLGERSLDQIAQVLVRSKRGLDQIELSSDSNEQGSDQTDLSSGSKNQSSDPIEKSAGLNELGLDQINLSSGTNKRSSDPFEKSSDSNEQSLDQIDLSSDSKKPSSDPVEQTSDLNEQGWDLIEQGSDQIKEGSNLIEPVSNKKVLDLNEPVSDSIEQGWVSIEPDSDSIEDWDFIERDSDSPDVGLDSLEQSSVSIGSGSVLFKKVDKPRKSSENVAKLSKIKLERSDYYTIPPLEKLEEYVRDGTCIVPNFTVGRRGYGKVYFSETGDVFGLNLDEIVHFRHKEITVYPNDNKKPPIGQGLNREAQVTLDRVWPQDEDKNLPITDAKRIKELKYVEKLIRISEKHNTAFLDYRVETGSWVFKVKHF